MKSRNALFLLMLPLFVQSLVATPISFPVEGSASFGGGAYGTWNFAFTSGPADLYLQEITIDLSPTNVRFDTAPGGFGSLDYLDIGDYQGTDASTGLSQILPGTGAALDGGQLLTFQFTDFTAGKAFHFTGDVDNPDPTLTPLKDCSGLGFWARMTCKGENDFISGANGLLLLNASLVTSQQFSGALVTYKFGGPDFYTSQFTTAFQPAGGLQILGSANGVVGNVQPVPEPATFVSLAIGMLVLGALRLRSR